MLAVGQTHIRVEECTVVYTGASSLVATWRNLVVDQAEAACSSWLALVAIFVALGVSISLRVVCSASFHLVLVVLSPVDAGLSCASPGSPVVSH